MTHVIQNYAELAETQLREDALTIIEAGYDAIDTSRALKAAVQLSGDTLTVAGHTYTLAPKQGVWVVGAGKCSIVGAAALEEILGERIAGGVVVDVSDAAHNLPLAKIEGIVGTHPRPTEVNEKAARKIYETLRARDEDDVVIMLVSGGGSTLLFLPGEDSLTCMVEDNVFDELTDADASIIEMNTVRKHLSLARGGALAKASYPAQVEALIFSDVPGNDLSTISSGPTVKDSTTVADAEAVIRKYNVSALAGVELLETPKEDRFFSKTNNTLLVSNDNALAGMADAARTKGYVPRIVTNKYTGEARNIAQDVLKDIHAAPKGSALLYGGESTVMLGEHSGKGGRNQELVLAALSGITEDEIIISFASDGHDNTDYAGAVCDSITAAHAAARKLSEKEHLETHRSYDFFSATGDALITGNIGANVSDLIITLKARA